MFYVDFFLIVPTATNISYAFKSVEVSNVRVRTYMCIYSRMNHFSQFYMYLSFIDKNFNLDTTCILDAGTRMVKLWCMSHKMNDETHSKFWG